VTANLVLASGLNGDVNKGSILHRIIIEPGGLAVGGTVVNGLCVGLGGVKKLAVDDNAIFFCNGARFE